ncbi:MAG: TolC family protein [Lepagella sp.]
MRLKTAIIAALALICLTASGETLTLSQCREMARENYPLVERYDLIDRTAEYTLSNLSKSYLPQILFRGQATYQSDVAALPEALQSVMQGMGYETKGIRKDQYILSLNLNQSIYDGGKVSASKRVAEEQRNVEKRQNDVHLYGLNERIDDLYFGILLLDRQIELNRELQTMLLDNCRKLEAMIADGIALQSDYDTMKAEQLKAAQQQIQLQSARQAYRDILGLFIGKDGDFQVEKPMAEMPESMEIDRPELKFYDSQIGLHRARLSQTDVAVRPTLSLFAQGGYGYPGYNLFESMTSHDWKLTGIVGLRLDWNISGFYTRRNERRKIETSIAEVENARDVFMFNTRIDITRQESEIKKYREVMAQDQEIMKLRQSIRSASEAKLEKGVIDINDLVKDMTEENRAKIESSMHEIEMLKSIYQLRNSVNR